MVAAGPAEDDAEMPVKGGGTAASGRTRGGAEPADRLGQAPRTAEASAMIQPDRMAFQPMGLNTTGGAEDGGR